MSLFNIDLDFTYHRIQGVFGPVVSTFDLDLLWNMVEYLDVGLQAG